MLSSHANLGVFFQPLQKARPPNDTPVWVLYLVNNFGKARFIQYIQHLVGGLFWVSTAFTSAAGFHITGYYITAAVQCTQGFYQFPFPNWPAEPITKNCVVHYCIYFEDANLNGSGLLQIIKMHILYKTCCRHCRN
jgi:hypothetical protein